MVYDVLVIGAGPTGMTAAIEAARAGLSVCIVDRASHRASHSQALVLQSRSLEQFQRYGIAHLAIERGRKILHGHIFSEKKQIVAFDFARIPSRYPYLLFLPQSETEALLESHMNSLGVTAQRETEMLTLSDSGDSVEVDLRGPQGVEQVTARWVIGCDGAHSTTRNLAGIPFEGNGVGLSFWLGDLELQGPDVPDRELVIHLHKGNVVFMGRLNDKLTRLVVALHSRQQDAEQQEQLTLSDFQDALDESNVRAKVLSSEWMTPFRVNDRQAKRYCAGNLFLAGDASHIHSPVGGQGMNTGLQDVANLIWKIAAVKRGAARDILDSYEEERSEVGRGLLRFTSRGLTMATTENRVLEGIRDLVLPVVAGTNTAQDLLARFISETAIQYRSSSIVTDIDTDGNLRAGDRMPDLPLLDASSDTLLAQWTKPGYLLITINLSASVRDELKQTYSHIESRHIEEAPLTAAAREEVGTQSKYFLLRPDGYIAFRGPASAWNELLAAARQNGAYEEEASEGRRADSADRGSEEVS